MILRQKVSQSSVSCEQLRAVDVSTGESGTSTLSVVVLPSKSLDSMKSIMHFVYITV